MKTLKIETKYEIGQKIWIVYENNGEVCIYDDTIEGISIDKDGILYFSEVGCIDLREDDIILYEDTGTLLNKIKDTMREIHIKEQLQKNN